MSFGERQRGFKTYLILMSLQGGWEWKKGERKHVR